MPRVTGILETALHTRDLPAAAAFYQEVLRLEIVAHEGRLCALGVAGRSLLLLFQEGTTGDPVRIPGGLIPPHDSRGSLHFAFSIDAADLPGWERHLSSKSVVIESRVHWDRGGTSLYFRDLDGHLVELATPGVWPIY